MRITKLNETNCEIVPINEPRSKPKWVHLNRIKLAKEPTIPPLFEDKSEDEDEELEIEEVHSEEEKEEEPQPRERRYPLRERRKNKN